jgi:hypothetical protein
VYLEVTLYPGMSILKKSADLTPTPQKGEGNYAKLKGAFTLRVKDSSIKSPNTKLII